MWRCQIWWDGIVESKAMLCRCGTQCHVTLTEFTLFSGVISGCKGSCSNQFGISGRPETWIMPDELNGAILFIHLFFLSGRCFVFVFCFCFFHLTLFFKKKKKTPEMSCGLQDSTRLSISIRVNRIWLNVHLWVNSSWTLQDTAFLFFFFFLTFLHGSWWQKSSKFSCLVSMSDYSLMQSQILIWIH